MKTFHPCNAGIPEYLVGDPEIIRQMILHLVGNAIKFTEKDSVNFRVNVDQINGKIVSPFLYHPLKPFLPG